MMTPGKSNAQTPCRMDLSHTSDVAQTGYFIMGASHDPQGREIGVNSRYLTRDGRPWLPVMGEFHYARYGEDGWRDELKKMKAGGIDIVATYVFWIHHEEIEGEYDWTGRRNLRRFVELCGEEDLYCVVRCGPWCHGEVRNGGLPDWILGRDFRARTNDPAYLDYVRRFYGGIARQISGLLWKDGGPVIGAQIENEFGGPAGHLLTLKAMLIDAGVDVPVYTRTGWPELQTPIADGELLPLEGAYAEGFWDRSLESMPGEYWETYVFRQTRVSVGIGTDLLGDAASSTQADFTRHPYLTCELGGGMVSSYHRRIHVDPMDIYAGALVKLGSGGNLIGYYMYHGGTNPEGRLTTLQESISTKYWNDLPIKNYDFQAPLGQCGQVREHYRLLRRMHLFLCDFGSELAAMPAQAPEYGPKDKNDVATLRWSVRSDGRSGYVFINHYQRRMTMPEKPGVQFELTLKAGESTTETLTIPAEPMTVPAAASFFMPFNMDLGGVRLIHATAQPLCRLVDGDHHYYLFSEIPGLASEWMFGADPDMPIQAAAKGEVVNGARLYRDVKPGRDAAFRIRRPGGAETVVVLLSDRDARHCWKGEWGGRDRIVLAEVDILPARQDLGLLYEDSVFDPIAVLPAPESVSLAGQILQIESDGVFALIKTSLISPKPVVVKAVPTRPAQPSRKVAIGAMRVAEAPNDEDFERAAQWRIILPEGHYSQRRMRLPVSYHGDAARLTLGERLLNDHFNDGNPLECLLTPEMIASEEPLTLSILPWTADAPIFVDRPEDAKNIKIGVENVTLELESRVNLSIP